MSAYTQAYSGIGFPTAYHDYDLTTADQDVYFPAAQPRYLHPRHSMHADFSQFNPADDYNHYYETQSIQSKGSGNGHGSVSNRHGLPVQYNTPAVGLSPISSGDEDCKSYSTGNSPTSRHATTGSASSASSPREKPSTKPTTTSSTTTTDRNFCPHPTCTDPSTGLPNKSFSRKADVMRHRRSTHDPKYLDCPHRRCPRKAEHGMGFTRTDHLTEHLRQTHCADIPKRSGGGSGKAGVGGGEGKAGKKRGRHDA